MNKSIDMRNSRLDQTYASNTDLNKSLVERSRIEGTIMLEKTTKVQKSRQNMEQLKHRIDALKRNVENVQKTQAKDERSRQQIEMAIRNKE